jgi:hypothetical protein
MGKRLKPSRRLTKLALLNAFDERDETITPGVARLVFCADARVPLCCDFPGPPKEACVVARGDSLSDLRDRAEGLSIRKFVNIGLGPPVEKGLHVYADGGTSVEFQTTNMTQNGRALPLRPLAVVRFVVERRGLHRHARHVIRTRAAKHAHHRGEDFVRHLVERTAIHIAEHAQVVRREQPLAQRAELLDEHPVAQSSTAPRRRRALRAAGRARGTRRRDRPCCASYWLSRRTQYLPSCSAPW